MSEFRHKREFRKSMSTFISGHEVESREGEDLTHAAVLILVMPDEIGRSGFLLTRRPLSMRRHSGQYALPGGRLESGESIEQAAIRETREEIGISLRPEHLLGRLDDFVTYSGFCITPVIGWIDEYIEPIPDPEEVARVFHIPLSDLVRRDIPRLTKSSDSEHPVLSVHLNTLGHEIYAPTAAILFQFREIAMMGRKTRVAHFNQPLFARK